MIEGFNFSAAAPEEIIKKYSSTLPKTLIEIWKSQGFGTIMDGYLKIINPDEYADIFNNSYYRSDVAIPIIVTAFGDIITWEKNKYVGIVQYRYGKSDLMITRFDLFLMLLKDNSFTKQYFNLEMYKDAISLYGKPNYDECFGFVPILAIGGSEKVDNLKIVKTKEHIALIAEIIGEV
ncbi:MAG: DUF1851 domain-containing protein [Ruminococcus sp.]|nr:DUF1851 domain-containing protein [Ruminococcus sp.]